MISLFSSHEFFPAFICINDTESLINNLFKVKIFNALPSFTSTSSPSTGCMGGKSTIFSLPLSAISQGFFF